MADGLGPGPSWPGTIVQALYVMRLSNWVAMAATILVLYDILLTLPSEIVYMWLSPGRSLNPVGSHSIEAGKISRAKRIWRWIRTRRPTFPTFLYFVNRYGVLVQAGLCNVANLDAALEGEECMRWTLFNNWSVPIGMLVVEAMLVLRVSALYLNARPLLLSLWATWLASLLLMCTFLSLSLQHTFPEPTLAAQVTGCLLGGAQRMFWAVWLPSLGLESVLFALMVLRVGRYAAEGVGSRVLGVVARDGVVYFIVIFFLLLTNVLVPLLSYMPYYSVMVELTLCLTSILCSRMYLNLRRAAHQRRSREPQVTGKDRTFMREWTIEPDPEPPLSPRDQQYEDDDEFDFDEEEGGMKQGRDVAGKGGMEVDGEMEKGSDPTSARTSTTKDWLESSWGTFDSVP